jgi:hypothetical protein
VGVVPVQRDPFEARSVAVARHLEGTSGVDQEVPEDDSVLLRQRVTDDAVESQPSPRKSIISFPLVPGDRDIICPRGRCGTHNIPPLLLNNLLTSTLAANSLLRHPSAGTQR